MYHGSEECRKIIAKYDLYAEHDSKKRAYLKRHIVLTTYETLVRESPSRLQKIDWETVTLDEGHRIKDRNSKTFEKLMETSSMARWRLLLTGTPVQNNLEECFNLMQFLDIYKFGDVPALLEKFSDLTSEKLAELHEMLRKHILRRMKSEVMADRIPGKVEVVVPVQMSPLQRDVYRKILTKNFSVLRHAASSQHARKTTMNNLMVELRKTLNHPYL